MSNIWNTLLRRGNPAMRAALAAAFLGSLLLLVGIGCSPGRQQAEAGGADLIPKGEIEGWNPTGEPEIYNGEDLFLYINGGAEIYHEYGFRRVFVQEYEHAPDRSISLEIYEMEDPGAAFGIYSFKSTPEGREVPVGRQGRLEDYYLNFWQGRYLVTLVGFDAEESTQRELLAIGEKVAAGIEGGGDVPALLSRLPREGLNGESLKYFRGPLGLFNSHRFFVERAVFMREGVRGDYDAGYSRFILRYESEEEGRAHWEALCEGFKVDPEYADFAVDGEGTASCSGGDGLRIQLRRESEFITILMGTPASLLSRGRPSQGDAPR